MGDRDRMCEIKAESEREIRKTECVHILCEDGYRERTDIDKNCMK